MRTPMKITPGVLVGSVLVGGSLALRRRLMTRASAPSAPEDLPSGYSSGLYGAQGGCPWTEGSRESAPEPCEENEEPLPYSAFAPTG